MRDIKTMNVVQIEATNVCNKSCSNCVRFCGHYSPDKIYWATLEGIEDALISYKDFGSIVGLIGGEPTLHPQFVEIAKLYKKHRPDRQKCGLWSNTTSRQFKDNRSLIDDVFGVQNLNDHTAGILHTPVLVSSESLSDSQEERDAFFEQCWIQMTWSATITPKGGYFCEVAAMLAIVFNGPDGRNVKSDPDWWKAPISSFKDQIDWACNKCGAAYPCVPRRSPEGIDDVSQDNLDRLILAGSPKIKAGKYEIYDKGLKFGQNRSCDWYWDGAPLSVRLRHE